jgi:uncharacterized protein
MFKDALTLDKTNRTAEGYLVIHARAARTGVYDYAGVEIDPQNKHGLKDIAIVKVLRDDATVFDESAMVSFVGKPVTINHPTVAVTADNWKQHASGVIHRVARDGDYFDITAIISDAAAIKAVNGGKRELSNGYTADLEFGEFTAADGTICQARQSKITGGNHVALVDRGRAGPECAIVDGFAVCDANPMALDGLIQKENVVSEVITKDGLPVNLADAVAVKALVTKLETEIADKAQEVTDTATKLSDATGKIAVLESELADARKAAEPAAIQAAATARANLIADAKKVFPGMKGEEEMSEEEIKKKALKAKMGDAADALDAAAINGAFAYAVAMPVADGLAKSIADNAPMADDAGKIRKAALAAKSNLYKGA